jgi:hypothetical protein
MLVEQLSNVRSNTSLKHERVNTGIMHMAKRIAPPPQLIDKQFSSADEIDRAIAKLERRIKDFEAITGGRRVSVFPTVPSRRARSASAWCAT